MHCRRDVTKDLFEHAVTQDRAAEMPLAARVRPSSIDIFIGHAELVGEGAPLRAALERDEVWSVVLWGPPGTGKTSLARIAARMTKRLFIELSAVSAGVRDVRAVIEQASDDRRLQAKRTLVFLDEIHRFNKAQQDALLPAVEEGTIALWGATTENPYFELNAPLLSRMRVLRLNPLTGDDLRAILDHAIETPQGLGTSAPAIEESAFEAIIAGAGGDARIALNWLEAVAAFGHNHGLRTVDADLVARATLERQVRYDRAADEHYDTISAFIKSVRGSDPDAALFWLAKMLKGGEAPEFIARRILILASEDIGNADPHALPLAVATASAVERVGLPEARFALSQATIYLSAAPKSNAAGVALDAATKSIAEGADLTVPQHLRSTGHTELASTQGHGRGYRYPHDYPSNYVDQTYMPQAQCFYTGHGSGYEQVLWKNLHETRDALPPKKRRKHT